MTRSIHQFFTRTETGAIVPNAEIKVNFAGGSEAPIFTTSTGGTAIVQPLIATASAKAVFYVEAGVYDIESKDPISLTTATFSNVEISTSRADLTSALDSDFNIDTTESLINKTLDNTPIAGTIYKTTGYSSKGDGGGAQWRYTGNTISTSQSPSDTGVAKISDANGNEFEIVVVTSINDKSLGSVGDGVTDDTLAIQATIDHAFNNKLITEISGGVHATTGIKAYGIFSDNGAGTILSGVSTKIVFSPGASLKMIAASGFVIRTAESPTVDTPTDEVLYGEIINPTIDMDSKGDVGIMMQCVHYWKVTNADIRNVPAGVFAYDDGSVAGVQNYDKAGIGLKGITGVAGSYNNRIDTPFIRGISSLVKGQAGVWLNTSQGQSNQRANFNEVTQGSFTYLETGVELIQGFNNRLSMLNVFECGTGMKINTGRNYISKPYLELCDVGIEFTSNSAFNVIESFSSKAGTTTPVQDDGTDNTMFPENFLARYGNITTGGGTTTGQIAPSGVFTKILFDSSNLTYPGSLTDTVNSRIVIDDEGDGEGLYMIIGSVRLAAVNGARYQLQIRKNGAVTLPQADVIPGSTNSVHAQVVSYLYLEKDDYVELWLNQNSGADLVLTDSSATQLFVVKQITHINKPFNR